MNCEQAQEMILTDYLDGCLDGPRKAQLEAHWEDCVSCREFAAVARQRLVAPFEALPRETMPEHVAQAIREQVRGQSVPRESWLDRLVETARGWRVAPAPALAWVTALVVCFIVVGAGTGLDRWQQARHRERVLFLAEVAESSATQGQSGADYGTSMESYFLDSGGNI